MEAVEAMEAQNALKYAKISCTSDGSRKYAVQAMEAQIRCTSDGSRNTLKYAVQSDGSRKYAVQAMEAEIRNIEQDGSPNTLKYAEIRCTQSTEQDGSRKRLM